MKSFVISSRAQICDFDANHIRHERKVFEEVNIFKVFQSPNKIDSKRSNKLVLKNFDFLNQFRTGSPPLTGSTPLHPVFRAPNSFFFSVFYFVPFLFLRFFSIKNAAGFIKMLEIFCVHRFCTVFQVIS